MSFTGKSHAAGSRARIGTSVRLARERRQRESQQKETAETISADLQALARRLMEAANFATTEERRADLNAAADIVWEYIVLLE